MKELGLAPKSDARYVALLPQTLQLGAVPFSALRLSMVNAQIRVVPMLCGSQIGGFYILRECHELMQGLPCIAGT